MNIARVLAAVLIGLVVVTGTNSPAPAKERYASARKIVAFGFDWRGRLIPIRTATRRGHLIRSGASRLILGIGF